MFRHLLVDEMQDTNIVQVELVEAIARAGAGNLTAVGDDAQSIYRFRGRRLRQHPQVPRPPPRRPRLPAGDQLSLDPRDRRLHQRLDRARTPPASPRPSSPPGPAAPARRRRHGRRLRGGRPHLPADARLARRGDRPLAGWRSSTGTTTTASSCRASSSIAASPTRSGAASGSSSRPTSRTCSPTCASSSNPRDEPAWGRLLLLLPGIGPAKAAAIRGRLSQSDDPLAAIETPDDDGAGAGQGQGVFAAFVADLRSIRKADPESNPAAAIAAVLKGGYPGHRQAEIRAPRQPDRRHRAARRPRRALRQPGASSSPTCCWPATSTAWTPSPTSRGRRRDARPEHDPPGEGAGVVAGVRPPPRRARLPLRPRARRARRRGGGAPDLLRRRHPGDGRALARPTR